MTPTPTQPDRRLRAGDFVTLNAALAFAAQQATGVNLYGLRGELIEAVPYAELRERAQARGRMLLAEGLRPGDRVGLVAETSAAFLVDFLGCVAAGLIPATLPLPQPLAGRDAYVDLVARLAAAAGAARVIGPPHLADWLAAAARRAGVGEPGPATGAGDLAQPTPDDLCYLQFSSGSTREPTGVAVTHRALMANAHAITAHGLQVTPHDRAVSWLPLFHDMGLVGFFLSALCSQMSVDLMPAEAFVRRPLLWPRLIAQNGGTISYSPSFGYELCARRAETADLSDLDLSGWRVAGVGGDMVRAGPLEAFAARFAAQGFRASAFVASYGMAEATLAMTMAPLAGGLTVETVDAEGLERRGEIVSTGEGARTRAFARCGPALAGHAIEVRGEGGDVLPERRVGRVFVQGPSLMRGYFGRPEATREVLGADGWLDTGDLGFLADGEFVPTGRHRDLILLNGRNLWPQDLEWTVEGALAGLRSGDVLAFAAPSDAARPAVALVQARRGDAAQREALRLAAQAVLLAQLGVEAEVVLVGAHALPVTSSGKLMRARARELYLSGAFAAEPA